MSSAADQIAEPVQSKAFSRLHDLGVEFLMDELAVSEALSEVQQHFCFEPTSRRSAAPDLRFRFISAEDPRSHLPDQASAEVLPPAQGIETWRIPGCTAVAGRFFAARIVPADQTCEVYLHTTLAENHRGMRSAVFIAVLTGVNVLLRARGYYPLHAGALEKNGQGLLLVADSDSGKSTLSYSLVRSGWNYVSDDSIFLHREEGGITALTFRRVFGLDHEAGDLFPELRREWEGQHAEVEKWSIPVHTLYPAQERDRCIPRLLVFPGIVDRQESSIRLVRKAEALHRLLRQSALATQDHTLASEHVALLTELVNQTRHYALEAGRGLKGNAPGVDALISELLSVPPAH